MDIDFRPKKIDRIDRINELIKEEVAQLVQKETHGKLVTVTGVETARDLKNANVWVGVLDTRKEEIVEHLNSIAFEFQGILGKRLDLRNVPRLYFKLDESGEVAAKVDKILDKEKNEN